MKTKYLLFIIICISISACGKVSNETDTKVVKKEQVFYTTLVGQVPIKAQYIGDVYTLSPSENVLIATLSLLNKDGSKTIQAWGKGIKEQTSTAEMKENPFIKYKSSSYNTTGIKITKESEEDIYIKWTKDDKWEYYLKLSNMDQATYIIELMNEKATKYTAIPYESRRSSENATKELEPASLKTTLWSRILIANENRNIVKKADVTLGEIKDKISDSMINALMYKQSDYKAVSFSSANPQFRIPPDNSVEFYLSEVLSRVKQDQSAYLVYLNTLPKQLIPTSAVSLMKQFKYVQPQYINPAYRPAPTMNYVPKVIEQLDSTTNNESMGDAKP